jgi:hypothetical protein
LLSFGQSSRKIIVVNDVCDDSEKSSPNKKGNEMSKRKVQVIKPYTYRDNFIDKLSIKDRTYLELLWEDLENAELEGEPDRPVNITREQVEARVAENKRKEKEQLKRYRLLMKELSTGDGKVSDR